MAIEDNLGEVINILPQEIISKVEFLIILIQALGGLLVIYLFLSVIRIIMVRKQNKVIGEIRKDVKYLKNKLKNKN